MSNFNPELLRKATTQTILFIAKTSRETSIFDSPLGRRGISSDFDEKHLLRWKSEKDQVFLWRERTHFKKEINNVMTYFNHWVYRYFLVPKDQQIKPIPAKNKYDFGYHRVKEALDACHAIPFLTITDEDLDGFILK